MNSTQKLETMQRDLNQLCATLDNLNEALHSQGLRLNGGYRGYQCDHCERENDDEYIFIIEELEYKPGELQLHFLCCVCLETLISWEELSDYYLCK